MPGRLFRALLMLLPAEFRADYGREMEATFRAEAAAETRTGRMRLWAATIVDLARTAPAEHLDILIRDLRFAVRTMLRHPVHTATALVTLMLGIGAAVAMFSVINAVLLSPLPYRDAGGLVIVQEQRESDEPGSLGYLTFADLRERARSMSVMAAVTQSFANLAGDGQEPERVGAMRVSASYFPMIGVSPALGRGFSEAEDRPARLDEWRSSATRCGGAVSRPIRRSSAVPSPPASLPTSWLVSCLPVFGIWWQVVCTKGQRCGFRWDTTPRPRMRAGPAGTCASSGGLPGARPPKPRPGS